ncbi:hypothetical protein M9H77_17342 [Catharanthus roseus]|uniref:Uncharacterized protein n=1 Tax=Catharanthus roseus TaxID=4058 RepID=A0ACC0B4B7_CATRO|nr:hypothetical protein M9H77_17342 [Catharanthus roseus]
MKYYSYNNKQDNNPEKNSTDLVIAGKTTMKQVYEIVNSEQKQNAENPRVVYQKGSYNSRSNKISLFIRSCVDLKSSGSRTVAPTTVALIPLVRFDLLPRDPSGLGLDTYSRSQTSSASSNRKNSSANRWPRRRKLSVSLSKNALSSHCSDIQGNPKVSQHRRANGSPEGSHRKISRRTARRKRERRQKVREQEAAAAQHRVKNERIRAAEENKMFI